MRIFKAAWKVLLLGSLCFAMMPGVVSAGPLDSVTKSVESGGGYVEKKSGSRSDTKKFPIHRWDSPGLKVQVPASYKVVNKDKSKVELKSSEGVAMTFQFSSASQDQGLARYRKEKDAAKEGQKSNKVNRVSDRNIDNVPGFETTLLLDGGDKKGRRQLKWQGYDADMKRYVVVTGVFNKNTYDNHSAAYDAIIQSIRWNYKK